jgi:hypothetical protein
MDCQDMPPMHFYAFPSVGRVGWTRRLFTSVAPKSDTHGPVRVARTFHFAYAYETPYYPFGTTSYARIRQSEVL